MVGEFYLSQAVKDKKVPFFPPKFFFNDPAFIPGIFLREPLAHVAAT